MPTPDRSEIEALIARVGALTGPDREIDGDIAIALELFPDGAMHMSAAPDPATFATGAHTSWKAPKWTESVDAGLRLAAYVLPRWSLRFGLSEGYRYPSVVMGRSYPTNASAAMEHHTAPLAIMSCILTALLHQAEAPDGR